MAPIVQTAAIRHARLAIADPNPPYIKLSALRISSIAARIFAAMDGRPLIAIFCNSFPPEGGAAAQRMYHMATLLRDAGYSVEVVSSMPNYPHGRIFQSYRNAPTVFESVDGISVQRCWLYPSNSRAVLPRAVNLLTQQLSFRLQAFNRIRKRRPALVIVSSPPLPMASSAVAWFRKAGIPVLLNVSDLWPLSAKVLGAASESAVYRHLQRLEHRMYRQATAISGQSESILRHISTALAAPKPTFLLRNLPGVDSSPLPVPDVIDTGTFRIIYPGLLGHAQGMLALVQAIDWRKLGATLDIYGAGAQRLALADWLKTHPELPVRLHDPVPEPALRELLHAYDAMLVPLVGDIPGAVPSKLFTAFHAGLPVLYSGNGEAAALVDELGLGLSSEAGDYVALASAIGRLAAVPHDERIRARQHIRETAQSHFNPASQDKAFLSFIKRLVK